MSPPKLYLPLSLALWTTLSPISPALRPHHRRVHAPRWRSRRLCYLGVWVSSPKRQKYLKAVPMILRPTPTLTLPTTIVPTQHPHTLTGQAIPTPCVPLLWIATQRWHRLANHQILVSETSSLLLSSEAVL